MNEVEEVAQAINQHLKRPLMSFQEARWVVAERVDDTPSVMTAVAEALWKMQPPNNAMQTAAKSKPTTIGELRKYLDDLAAAWTEVDTEYLGRFEDQQLYLLQDGIAHAEATYLAEFGLTFLPRISPDQRSFNETPNPGEA